MQTNNLKVTVELGLRLLSLRGTHMRRLGLGQGFTSATSSDRASASLSVRWFFKLRDTFPRPRSSGPVCRTLTGTDVHVALARQAGRGGLNLALCGDGNAEWTAGPLRHRASCGNHDVSVSIVTVSAGLNCAAHSLAASAATQPGGAYSLSSGRIWV